MECNMKDICMNSDECYNCQEMDNYEPGEAFSCFSCPGNSDCEYAWDFYNLNNKCRVIGDEKVSYMGEKS